MASEDFKKRTKKLMLEKSLRKATIKNSLKKLSLIAASFLLIVGIISVSAKHVMNSSMPPIKPSSDCCGGSSVSNMFLSDGILYYARSGKTLYRYSNLTGKSRIELTLGNTPSNFILGNKGYIYYSSGSAIYQKSLKNGVSNQIVKAKNIWVDLIGGDKLFYHISYKDSDGPGYSEFEYHYYDLKTGKDNIFSKRSKDNWHPIAADDINLIVDGNSQNGAGIFVFDLSTGTRKKLASMRSEQGCIINDIFCFISKDLWSVKLNGDKLEKIALLGMDERDFLITDITGLENTIYVATSSAEKNNILALDLKTKNASTLAIGPKRMSRLCTDGKKLYFYCSDFFEEGYIASIPLGKGYCINLTKEKNVR